MEFKHTTHDELFGAFPDQFLSAEIHHQGNAMASLGLGLHASLEDVLDAFDRASTVGRLIACYALGMSSWIAQ